MGGSLLQFIDRLWVWFSAKIFVRFQFDLPVAALKEQAKKGKIVFALTSGGLLEWLILTSWCRSEGFGAILVANRKWILCFSKPKYFFQILFRRRRYCDLFLSEEAGPRLVFCPPSERKKAFVPTKVERLLSEMHAESTARGDVSQILFVPVLILWRKHTRGSRNLSEYLFGLSSRPNWIGKFWYLWRRRNDSTVRALKSFGMDSSEAREGMDQGDVLEETESMRAAKFTRRRILVEYNQEMRIVLGPRYQSHHSVKETLIRDPDIQAMVSEVAATERVDRRKVMSRAYQNLTEIVASYRFGIVEVLFVFLGWLFTRVFDGLDAKGEQVQSIREGMKQKAVVFIPCHRSHLDYLVIPYVLFLHDMITPHIIAGINMAFWPVGSLLRTGGAFFIRRSFRGDPLYGLCVKKYLAYLLKNRFKLMFFIEGTRSRSGKMLPPAYGILKMVLEACQRREVDDITLVPVSLCYDEVPEQSSYTKELGGGQKIKESARELFKSRKIVNRNIGKVYVNFAPAISARGVVESEIESGQELSLALQKTAFLICKSINDATPVTPKSIVSTIMLAHILSSLSLEEVLRLSDLLYRYVVSSGMPLSATDEAFRRSIEHTIRKLNRSGVLSVAEGLPRAFYLENKKRVLLNFYKNNAIHCLIIPSIAMISFFETLRGSQGQGGEEFDERFKNNVLKVRNLLKFEFFFSPTPTFLEEIGQSLEYFFGAGGAKGGTIPERVEALKARFPDWNDLSVFVRLPGDLFESILSACRCFAQGNCIGLERRQLSQRILKMAEGRLAEGGLSFPESVSLVNFANAISLLENQKLIQFRKEEDRQILESVVTVAELNEWSAQIQELLNLIQEKPENIVYPESRLLLA